MLSMNEPLPHSAVAAVAPADGWRRDTIHSTAEIRSVVEALRMLTELARGPQAPQKPRRETISRLRPRVARTPRRSGGQGRGRACGSGAGRWRRPRR